MSASTAVLQSPARLFKAESKTDAADITWRFVAHRGANNAAPHNTLIHRPENTLPAMHEAYRVGAHYVECDIFLTRDQRIVVIHDDTLHRTASFNPAKKLTREQFEAILHKKIPELSYADEVSQVSVGAYDPLIPAEFHDTPISPLEDFLSVLQGDANRRLVIELKAGDIAIVPVLEQLIKCYSQAYQLQPEQLLFISFDYHLIAACKAVLPQHKHFFLTIATPDPDQVRPDPEQPGKTLGYYHLLNDKHTLEHYIQMAKDAKLDGLDVEYDAATVNAEMIHTIHAANLQCAIWTYAKDDTLETAKKMLAANADFINTNQPQFIFEQLQPTPAVDERSTLTVK